MLFYIIQPQLFILRYKYVIHQFYNLYNSILNIIIKTTYTFSVQTFLSKTLSILVEHLKFNDKARKTSPTTILLSSQCCNNYDINNILLPSYRVYVNNLSRHQYYRFIVGKNFVGRYVNTISMIDESMTQTRSFRHHRNDD